jgi:hypothetical protein
MGVAEGGGDSGFLGGTEEGLTGLLGHLYLFMAALLRTKN